MLCVMTLSGFLPSFISSSLVCVNPATEPMNRQNASRMSFFMVQPRAPQRIPEMTLEQLPVLSSLRAAGAERDQRPLHRFACGALDERRDEIAQERGDVPAEADRFALGNHTA